MVHGVSFTAKKSVTRVDSLQEVTHRKVTVLFPTAIGGLVSRQFRDLMVSRTGEIDGNAIRRAQLVVARISFADGRIGVVDAGEYAGSAQFGGYSDGQSMVATRR